MTRTAADVQAEIDALDEAEGSSSELLEAAVDVVQGDDVEWRKRMKSWRQQLTAWSNRAEALRAERARLAREELDAATSERNRGWAMALREAWLGQDPFAELDEDDYITNRDLERLEAWKQLPLNEAQRWARVADALERGWY